ncbi:MAG: diaminopimelate decarboxylase [Candidatus Peribacteria bacterium]|nr:MAG: diaminopimelate decarboxylase [Candidatus Peribacteria bacterium]
MGPFNFLTRAQVDQVCADYTTPVYVYSENKLEEYADAFLAFPSAYGCTVRYAMKANSNGNILKIFNNKGIKIDASSEYEVYRAIAAGVDPHNIQISGQELPMNYKDLIEKGVFFVATSLHQLETIGKEFPGIQVGVRINPGVGSAAFKKVNTGGWISAFGIWHEYLPEIKRIANQHDLIISKVHIHIGSENTPKSWVNSANIGLELVEYFDDVDTLDMGGGFKMAIMPYEESADLQSIGEAVKEKFEDFYKKTGRKIHLEVEPGKYLVINTCSVVAKIADIVDTGPEGYKFIRTNTGMTEMPRVTMYGVQQPIIVVNDSKETEEYVVVGHCCESGDILTAKLYDHETIEEVTLSKASIGDPIVFEGTGAYNAAMSMKHYNSFPEAGELLVRTDGSIVEMRKRQVPEALWGNEVEVIV